AESLEEQSQDLARAVSVFQVDTAGGQPGLPAPGSGHHRTGGGRSSSTRGSGHKGRPAPAQSLEAPEEGEWETF
ncbi:MAG: hypothetical protein ACLFTM_09105, partial [Ectothiorhodospira sp.]